MEITRIIIQLLIYFFTICTLTLGCQNSRESGKDFEKKYNRKELSIGNNDTISGYNHFIHIGKLKWKKVKTKRHFSVIKKDSSIVNIDNGYSLNVVFKSKPLDSSFICFNYAQFKDSLYNDGYCYFVNRDTFRLGFKKKLKKGKMYYLITYRRVMLQKHVPGYIDSFYVKGK